MSAASNEEARSRPRRAGTGPVWLVSGAMAAAGVAVHQADVRDHEVLSPSLGIPWFLLAAAILVAESQVVHLRFRSGAHSLSLSEVPLVVGLFFTSGSGLVAAQVAGGALALAYRRQQPVKLVFNLTSFLFESTVAVMLFRRIVEADDPMGASGWVAAFVATSVAGLFRHLAVDLAIFLSEGGLEVGRALRSLGFGLAGTFANTSFGLAAALVLWERPEAIWLLGVPAAVLAAAYRAYVSERAKRDQLEFLYTASRLVQSADEFGEVIVALLRHTREMLHAELVELSVRPSRETQRLLRTTIGPGDALDVLVPVSPQSSQPALAALDGRRGVVSITDAGECGRVTGGRGRDLATALVAPLCAENETIGTFVVGRSPSAVSGFDAEERRIFETLANQVSVVLENGQLGRSLARLKSREQRLAHQASHDPLTNLANRALFVERTGAALERSQGEQVRSAVLFIDLDDFKAINDRFGHATGDRVLVSAAERVLACVRPSDLAARFGGDEFAILLEDVPDTAAAVQVGERILAAFLDPMEIEGNEHLVQPSVGLAFADSCDDVTQVLGNADAAMYAAKRSGKGCLRLFEHGAGA